VEIPHQGVVVIDKPAGITSHDVVNMVRKAAGVARVGHAGTLDPFATGVLVIMIGRQATRRSAALSGSDKEYLATVEFGRTTDTLDPTGDFIGRAVKISLDAKKLKKALKSFIGSYTQAVPRFSAVKVGGRKLYEKARRGEQFQPPRRKVIIRQIELLDLFESREGFPQAKIRVVCSAGTYLRSLARDLGERLGAPAYLVALRRLRQGAFTLAQAVPLP
jgi:tRNA pseudouridine55 synthase